MKAILAIIFAYLIAAAIDSHATEMTGQCVFPKASPEQIEVFALSSDKEAKTNVLKFRAYKVGIRSGIMIAIWSVPDNGKVGEDTYRFVGWINRDTVDTIDQRNCN